MSENPKAVLRRHSSDGDESGTEELVDVLRRNGIARKGNGADEELSMSQLNLIHELYDNVSVYREALPAYDREWCDLECVRRYLVARSWNVDKAKAQLTDTLQWRASEEPAAKEFFQSSKASKDPFALNMRLVGSDAYGRPICYTRFSEAHDRWDADANLDHLMLLLEGSSNFIRKRQQKGLNQNADTRQCVWVVDFDGFCMRDQNPRTGYFTAALLQHYPELLNLVVLIDAPFLFNGLWKLASPLLDDRVRRKFMFVKGKQADTLLRERMGQEAAEWLAKETQDSADKKLQKGPRRKYWTPPEMEGQHDPRGMPSYVGSDLYVKTPGDAYEEARQVKLKPAVVKTQHKEAEAKDNETPVTKTIFSGSF